jgi:tetratricopeptide (TPR) repeat protein
MENAKYAPQMSWWEQLQSFYATSMKVFFAVVILVLVAHALYELFRYDMIILPFETPFNLARQEGYSGTVVAYRLQDAMNKKRDELKRSSLPGIQAVAAIQLTELQRRPEIEVPAVGLSLNAIIEQLRRIFRIQPRRVSGDIVMIGEQLHLTVRITGKPANTFIGDKNDPPEPIIQQAAEYVLKTFEPLSFGLNYCINNKSDLLASLIHEIYSSQAFEQKKPMALMLEGCRLKNQNRFEEALKKLDQALQNEALENDSLRAMSLYLKGETLLEDGQPDLAISEYQKALKIYPKNGVIYAQLAQALIANGKTAEAFRVYQKAMIKDPNNPWVYTAWGNQLAELKEFEEADKKFEQALEIDPNYALAYANWGDVLLKKRYEYQQAAEKYEQAVNLDSSIAWVYGNWGVALVSLGESEKALDKFNQSLELKPMNWVLEQFEYVLKRLKKPELFAKYEPTLGLKNQQASYYEAWGTLLADLKQYEAAFAKYQKALAIKPDEGFYYFSWANVLVDLAKAEHDEAAQQKYQQAVEHYQKAVQLGLSKRSTLAWGYSGWGDALVGLKQYEAAIGQYQKALKLNHRMPALIYNKLAYAIGELNQPAAFAKYESVINDSQNNLLSRRYYYQWGRSLATQYQPSLAIIQYQKALELDPKHIWSRIMLGHELVQVQKPEMALIECETLLNSTLDSDTVQAAVDSLCGLAKVRLNQLSEGVADCQKALQLYEKEDWAYWCLADALVAQKKPAEAVIQYQKAVQLKPENAFYRYQWAKVLVQLEQDEAALMQYQKAVELDKEGEIGKKAQAAIANLQS